MGKEQQVWQNEKVAVCKWRVMIGFWYFLLSVASLPKNLQCLTVCILFRWFPSRYFLLKFLFVHTCLQYILIAFILRSCCMSVCVITCLLSQQWIGLGSNTCLRLSHKILSPRNLELWFREGGRSHVFLELQTFELWSWMVAVVQKEKPKKASAREGWNRDTEMMVNGILERKINKKWLIEFLWIF